MTAENYELSIKQIQNFLPHRPPFLLVDKILKIQFNGDVDAPPPHAPVGTKVTGLKNVSFNEPYFQGHFPDYPIMPGVLIVETMAQVASFSAYPNLVRDVTMLSRDFQCILVGVDQVRFRKPVFPGDSLIIETEVIRTRGKLWGFQCTASVAGQKVAEAELLINLLSGPSQEKR